MSPMWSFQRKLMSISMNLLIQGLPSWLLAFFLRFFLLFSSRLFDQIIQGHLKIDRSGSCRKGRRWSTQFLLETVFTSIKTKTGLGRQPTVICARWGFASSLKHCGARIASHMVSACVWVSLQKIKTIFALHYSFLKTNSWVAVISPDSAVHLYCSIAALTAA